MTNHLEGGIVTRNLNNRDVMFLPLISFDSRTGESNKQQARPGYTDKVALKAASSLLLPPLTPFHDRGRTGRIR